jgi:hypothetical protein
MLCLAALLGCDLGISDHTYPLHESARRIVCQLNGTRGLRWATDPTTSLMEANDLRKAPTVQVAWREGSEPRKVVHKLRISDQQFQAGQFPASVRAPQSTCRKDSLPLQRLESTTMSDIGRVRFSAQIIDLEQWCILG